MSNSNKDINKIQLRSSESTNLGRVVHRHHARNTQLHLSSGPSEVLDSPEEIILNPLVDDEEFDKELSRHRSNRFSIFEKIVPEYALRNLSDQYDSGLCSSETTREPDVTEDTLNLRIENIENKGVCFFEKQDWLLKKKHIFILSFAGKPIYSLQGHGYEDQMASIFALIQCFISSFVDRDDCLKTIEADGVKFVFLARNPLYLVASSRDNTNADQLQLQLRELYNQIIFLLTFSKIERIFKERPSYDLRQIKKLNSNFKLITNLLNNYNEVSNNVFTFLTNSFRVLPLIPTVRVGITNIIQKQCSKNKDLAFALLITENQLIALIRLKNCIIHPSDIRLLFNLIDCLKTSITTFDVWKERICLPKFDMHYFLHASISCISEECQVYLILLSFDFDDCTFSQTHKNIRISLHEEHCIQKLSQQIKKVPQQETGFNIAASGIPHLLHFFCKPKLSPDQLLCSKIIPPYTKRSDFERLQAIYRDLHHRIHNRCRPLKLIFEVKEKEVAIALKTKTAEIYAVFDPLVNNISVVRYYIDELVKWINKEHEAYFILRYPTFSHNFCLEFCKISKNE